MLCICNLGSEEEEMIDLLLSIKVKISKPLLCFVDQISYPLKSTLFGFKIAHCSTTC